MFNNQVSFEEENKKFLETFPTTRLQEDYYVELANKIFTKFEIDDLESVTDYGVRKNIQEWMDKKDSLFQLFRKHPQWNEAAKAIVFSVTEVRAQDEEVFRTNLQNIRNIYSSVEEYDYLRELLHLSGSYLLTEADAELLTRYDPDGHYRAGGKTSRAINKYCDKIEGFTALRDYQVAFAKLADAINPMQVQRITAISVGIGDYLLMSNGNSWASCHYINSHGLFHRNQESYGGCYKNGTLSYAEDDCSIVVYTVDQTYSGEISDLCFAPKITRNMFHYNNGYLLQARVYPQSSSQDRDVKKPMREIVQSVIAMCEAKPNLWDTASGRGKFMGNRHGFTHYEDYCCSDFKPFTSVASWGEEHAVEIGSIPYSLSSGHENESQRSLTGGCICASCGCDIDEGDEYYINGEVYCNDCVSYCDDCSEYVVSDMTEVYVNGWSRWVCEDCLENNYTRCDDCDEYYSNDNVTDVCGGNRCVCQSCLRDNYVCCDDCGEYVCIDETTTVHSGDCVCDDCLRENYIRCDCCDEYYPNDELNEICSSLICEGCLRENYTECSGSGELIQNDKVVWVDGKPYSQDYLDAKEKATEEIA